MRINGNKPKGKNTMKEKLQVAPPGFEPTPQLPQRYIWGKIPKQVFESHFGLFPCLFTLRHYNGRSMNALVFFLYSR